MKKHKLMVGGFLATAIFFGSFGCMSSEGATETEKPATPKIEAVVQNNSATVSKIPRQDLIIYSTPAKYSYENLLQDIKTLENNFPAQVQVVELCDTPDGRKVIDVILGDINGDKQILIFGAMHAREYITVQTVMRQLCEIVDAINGYGGTYQGIPVAELLQGVTIHFVPNDNPDGVAISQFGLSGINNSAIRQQVSAIGGNLQEWKANARGVDLNRNFDAGWQEFYGSPAPSSERYKGTSPGSEPEAAALIKLVQDYPIKRTISYHTCGDLIYWYYKQQGAVLEESKKFAQRISSETGYYLDSDYTAIDAAGFKDWAVYKMGIPSITIETGAENGASIVGVVPISRFNNIWQRNKNVVYATVYNLKYE